MGLSQEDLTTGEEILRGVHNVQQEKDPKFSGCSKILSLNSESNIIFDNNINNNYL